MGGKGTGVQLGVRPVTGDQQGVGKHSRFGATQGWAVAGGGDR